MTETYNAEFTCRNCKKKNYFPVKIGRLVKDYLKENGIKCGDANVF